MRSSISRSALDQCKGCSFACIAIAAGRHADLAHNRSSRNAVVGAAQRSIPTIAQLVEHLTVEFADIRWSLVRFRVAGFNCLAAICVTSILPTWLFAVCSWCCAATCSFMWKHSSARPRKAEVEEALSRCQESPVGPLS